MVRYQSFCPTCGHWGRMWLRPRKGQRLLVKMRRIYFRGPWFWEQRGPSIRVYWPLGPGYRGPVAYCPDAWHNLPVYRTLKPNEPYDGLNRHDDNADAKRHAKGLRHKQRQGKEHR